MKKLGTILAASCLLLLSGCVVRSYQMTKDRVDQDLTTGNRGFLMGQGTESIAPAEKKTTRTVQAIEIELHSPIRFERINKAKPVQEVSSLQETSDREAWGNRGYITQSVSGEAEAGSILKTEQYTVRKNDTLQKISKNFYGTTKKWNKIYEANRANLKGPNKIYPGQVLEIPMEPAKEEGQKKIK